MHLATWIVGSFLGIVFIVLAVGNGLAVANYFVHKKHVSAIPVLGGAAGLVACFLLPIEGVRPLWWLPLIVDYGSVPLIVNFFVSRIVASMRRNNTS